MYVFGLVLAFGFGVVFGIVIVALMAANDETERKEKQK